MLHEKILLVRDESATGKVYSEQQLHFTLAKVTVRDVIIERVTQEVAKYNNQQADTSKLLVTPKDDELLLNQSQAKGRSKVNLQQQIEIALLAFQKNGFFLLVDDMQVDDLEQQIQVEAGTVVSFIKLTPLVGG